MRLAAAARAICRRSLPETYFMEMPLGCDIKELSHVLSPSCRNNPRPLPSRPRMSLGAEEIIKKYPPGRQASAVIALLWRGQRNRRAGSPSQ